MVQLRRISQKCRVVYKNVSWVKGSQQWWVRTLCLATEGLYHPKLEGERGRNQEVPGSGEGSSSCTWGLPHRRCGLQYKDTIKLQRKEKGKALWPRSHISWQCDNASDWLHLTESQRAREAADEVYAQSLVRNYGEWTWKSKHHLVWASEPFLCNWRSSSSSWVVFWKRA